jgi:dienelactone hydrolase
MTRRPRAVVLRVAAVALATVGAAGCGGSAAGQAQKSILESPAPSGRYVVGTESVRLVERARDPFVPRRRSREVMLQLSYPAAGSGSRRLRYMPDGVARMIAEEEHIPARLLETLQTHSYPRASVRVASAPYPVLVFSPGYGVSRLMYTGLFEDLASRGFMVAALDHTYEAAAVEFPRRRVVRRTLPGDPGRLPPRRLSTVIDTRVSDLRYALSAIGRLNHRGRFRGSLQVDGVGVLGHSLGGLTAARVTAADPRIACGADLDGSVFGGQVRHGLAKPFLLMSEWPRREATLTRFWLRLRGFKRWVLVRGTRHLDFSDWTWLAPLLRSRGVRVSSAELGPIGGRRALQIERSYLGSFFSRCLRAEDDGLLDRVPSRYPEVRVRR